MSEVKSIAVIGAGTMGSGIALTAATASASAGIRALVIDVNPEQLEKARTYHAKTLARNVEKQRMTKADADAAASRISYHGNIAEAKGADFAVEAATENPETKKKIFRSM